MMLEMKIKAVRRHQQSFQPTDIYGSGVHPNVRVKMIWHRSVFSDLPDAGDQHVAGHKSDHPQREQFRESGDRHCQKKPKVTDHAANQYFSYAVLQLTQTKE